MASHYILSKTQSINGLVSRLSSSKSISNRALILNALTNNQSVVSNLSEARDTVLMKKLISTGDHEIDAMDAGTTMRFLIAYFAVKGIKKVLTGTPRMKERPLGILVDALRSLGANIEYLEKEGYAPIAIKGFEAQSLDQLDVPGNISSQYISALMMVAPILPNGLTLHLTGKIGSAPYIHMTAALMKKFGVDTELNLENHLITIKPATYKPTSITVEPDWSAISYWFGFVALAKEAHITLPGVAEQSLQGDRVIVDIMGKLGVVAAFTADGLMLTKGKPAKHLEWDFTHCPDLAQTVLPVCAALGVSGDFTGLESLRIKETDRIAALEEELAKIGASLTEPKTGAWLLAPGEVPSHSLDIKTYHDHRMAMGLATWATLTELKIHDPEVVNKSYPGFWEDVKSIGIAIEEVEG